MTRLAVAALGAATLGAAAGGLALAALYIFAAGYLGGMLAAVVTAGGALVLGALLLGIGCGRRAARRGRRRRSADPEELAGLVLQLLRRNPQKAVLAALAGGAALGLSPALRRSLMRLIRELGDLSNSR